MTELAVHIREGVMRRSAGIAAVGLSAALAALAIYRLFPTFTGSGADMANHYALVYWFSHHWLSPAHNAAMQPLEGSPVVAQFVAGLLGRGLGSPFRGMQLEALASVALIWWAIAALLSMLPGRRRWVALVALAVILTLDTSHGPLQLDVHGFEIVTNFFLAQIVAQIAFWWLALFLVRRKLSGHTYLSSAVPIAVVAVLLTYVHGVPAVELLMLVGCVSAAEVVERWRRRQRAVKSYLAPVVLPALTAIAMVLSPPFRAQRSFSANNGFLHVPFLPTVVDYVGVALGVGLLSLRLLVLSRRRRYDAATTAVVEVLAFVGGAIALSCVVQAAALSVGLGSQYAVKKYIFGLLTVLVLDACVLAAVRVPLDATHALRPRTAARFVAVGALTALAMLSVGSHRGGDYSVSRITSLERDVGAVADDAHIERKGNDYAVGLPHADSWLNYMFSISILGASMTRAETFLLGGDALDAPPRQVVTASNSAYDRRACRTFGPRDGLAVVKGACVSRAFTACGKVNSSTRVCSRVSPLGGANPARRGYCLNGRFLLLELANFIAGKGLTCGPPPAGFVRRGFATAAMQVPPGIYPYYAP
jgi:hypothetical protein